VIAGLEANGFVPYVDEAKADRAGGVVGCCGETMTYRGLRRGVSVRGWAVCPACLHWVAL
jgi:hypothetical protein